MLFGTIVTVLSVGIKEMGYLGMWFVCVGARGRWQGWVETVQRQSFNNNPCWRNNREERNTEISCCCFSPVFVKQGRYRGAEKLHFRSAQWILLGLNTIWIPTQCSSHMQYLFSIISSVFLQYSRAAIRAHCTATSENTHKYPNCATNLDNLETYADALKTSSPIWPVRPG